MKLLQFKQENCTPCKMAAQFIENDLQTQADETYVMFAGDKEADALANRYGVMQSPTFVLVTDAGDKIDMVRGVGQQKLRAIFQKRGLI